MEPHKFPINKKVKHNNSKIKGKTKYIKKNTRQIDKKKTTNKLQHIHPKPERTHNNLKPNQTHNKDTSSHNAKNTPLTTLISSSEIEIHQLSNGIYIYAKLTYQQMAIKQT